MRENWQKEVLQLIKDVGIWVEEERLKVSSNHIETKSLNSFVSYVDKEAEKLLIEGFKKSIPGSGVIAEESGDFELLNGFNWIIDPLDGTTNYIHGLKPYAISVALMLESEIIWSAILDLSTFKMYMAEKGKGAFCNEIQLDITKGGKLSDGIIGTGFPYYDFAQVNSYLKVLKKCFENSRGVRRFGSAAIDLCLVAEGKFVAFFEYGLAPWDIAAGILIIREAGGVVGTFDSEEISDRNMIFARNIVAGNPNSFTTLANWTNEYFEKIES